MPHPAALDGRCVPVASLDPAEIDAWRRIQAETPALDSPYFTPEFAAAVGRVRPDVRVAILERAGEPLAFFPHERIGRAAWPVGGSFNDFQALVASADLAWSPADLLGAARVRRLHFDHWLASQDPVAPYAARVDPSPFADLSDGFAAYAAGVAVRSDQLVKVGQRQRKIAREHGPTRFVLCSEDRAALAQVVEWKAAQFRRSGLPDPFAHAWTRDLLASLLETKTEALSGCLSTLHAGDRLIAAHFGMRSRGVLHYWFPVYDHDFHSYGPGLLLLVEILQAAAAAGVRRVDFGKGEDAWKPRFMSGAVAVAEGLVEQRGLGTGLRRLSRGVVHALRRTPLRRLGAWPARRLRHLSAQRRLRDRA